jgi:uncharacterized membrane protein
MAAAPSDRPVAGEGLVSAIHRPHAYRHPVNQKMVDQAPLGARIADGVTGFLGSWRFLIIQTIVVAFWIVGNALILSRPFDPYPFILLNLAFSTQAAYAAPLILLAGNRAALRDRMTLEHAASEADIEDAQNRQLLEGNTQILQRVESLEKRILDLEKNILAAIGGNVGPSDTVASPATAAPATAATPLGSSATDGSAGTPGSTATDGSTGTARSDASGS